MGAARAGLVTAVLTTLVACGSNPSRPQVVRDPCRYLSVSEARQLLGEPTVGVSPGGVALACSYQTLGRAGGPGLVLQIWRGSLASAARPQRISISSSVRPIKPTKVAGLGDSAFSYSFGGSVVLTVEAHGNVIRLSVAETGHDLRTARDGAAIILRRV